MDHHILPLTRLQKGGTVESVSTQHDLGPFRIIDVFTTSKSGGKSKRPTITYHVCIEVGDSELELTATSLGNSLRIFQGGQQLTTRDSITSR